MEFDVVHGRITKIPPTQSLVKFLTEYFKESGEGGTLYLGYPLTASADSKITIDALLASENNGLIAFVFPSDHNNIEMLKDEQDVLYYQLDYNFKQYDSLRNRRELAFKPMVVTIFPDDKIPEIDSDYDLINVSSIGEFLSTNQEFDSSLFPTLCEVLQRVSNIKPRKKRENVKNDMSYGGIIRKIEKEIANLDQWQKKAAYELPEGPQRIRGLAGSGKTIVLALKAAYLHSEHPDWKIAVTYYTRSLSQQYKELIRQFSFEFAREEPNWNNLQVVHAWGTNAEKGIYSIAASSFGFTPHNFVSAKNQFGRSTAFSGACEEMLGQFDENNQPIYDAILIDEAQDLPSSFFKLVFHLAKDPKRITWAYDELQNLNETAMPSLEEMFGKDDDGNLKFTLENKEDEAKRDIILPVCYRNPPWVLTIAHALGFGLYRDNKVQMFDNLTIWEDIGYSVISGKLEYGKKVVLKRHKGSTPLYFHELLTPTDSISSKIFASVSEQYKWVAEQIHKNITEDELDPDDIMVIFPNAYYAERHYTAFRPFLNNLDIYSVLAGVNTDRDTFRIPDYVTCSSIYRAKGNEAPMVYIVNSEYCSDGYELIKLRNTLFTAITRSRAWIRICGVGEEMEPLKQEIDKCVSKDYSLDFKVPSKKELENIRRINRERSQEELKKVKSAKRNINDLIAGIQKGDINIEDVPELQTLINTINRTKKKTYDEEE